jgi:hypothetical protein
MLEPKWLRINTKDLYSPHIYVQAHDMSMWGLPSFVRTVRLCGRFHSESRRRHSRQVSNSGGGAAQQVGDVTPDKCPTQEAVLLTRSASSSSSHMPCEWREVQVEEGEDAWAATTLMMHGRSGEPS